MKAFFCVKIFNIKINAFLLKQKNKILKISKLKTQFFSHAL